MERTGCRLTAALAVLLTSGSILACSSTDESPSGPTSPSGEPTVAILSPSDGDTISFAMLPLEAVASDDKGVAVVRFFVDGTSPDSLRRSNPPYKVLVSTEAWPSNSVHTVFARVEDTDSNVVGSRVITVFYSASPHDTMLADWWIPTSAPQVFAITAKSYAWTDHSAVAAELRGVFGGSWTPMVILDQARQDIISSLTLLNSGYWIGGFHSPPTGFQWITGDPWSFTYWLSGQPLDLGTDCAVAYQSNADGWYNGQLHSQIPILFLGEF